MGTMTADEFVNNYHRIMKAITKDPLLLKLVSAERPEHDHLVVSSKQMLGAAGFLLNVGAWSDYGYTSNDAYDQAMNEFQKRFMMVDYGDYPGAADDFTPCWMVIRDKLTELSYRFDYEHGVSYRNNKLRLDNYLDPENTPFLMLQPVINSAEICFNFRGKPASQVAECLSGQNLFLYNQIGKHEHKHERYLTLQQAMVMAAEDANDIYSLARQTRKFDIFMIMKVQGEGAGYQLLIGDEVIPLLRPGLESASVPLTVAEDEGEVVWLAQYELGKRETDFAKIRESIFMFVEQNVEKPYFTIIKPMNKD